MAQTQSFAQQVRSLPANFWFANFMEVLERLAYFGVRAVTPLFLVASAGKHGLGLTYDEKGTIYGIWALLQCLIPMVSGGYADRYGYRKSLAVAFTINILGYLGMALSLPISQYVQARGLPHASFWVFLAAACLIGTGTAIFKPPCQGTIAKCTTEETSSMGWGLFYWVVNIGGALGPIMAAQLRREIAWSNVFYAAAIITALNFLPAFLLYKEPERPAMPESAEEGERGPIGVFFHSILTVFEDLRLLVFLLIFSCFWLMFMQLFDLLPNFIDEWVNTSDVASIFAKINPAWIVAGQVKPEMIINIDAIAIVLLVIPISWLVGKINKLAAMVIGMTIAVVGLIGSGSTRFGWLCCLMIFIFSLGEMASSPTFNAYVGLIAPKDKKALYMGYANIPFAIGWAIGAKVGGVLYEQMAAKFRLAREYLIHLGFSPDFAKDATELPKERVMEVLQHALNTGHAPAIEQKIQSALASAHLTGAAAAAAPDKVAAVIDRALDLAQGMSTEPATQLLWNLHHPYMVWVYLGAIGMVGTIGMIFFYLVTRITQKPRFEAADDS